jgi:hypothetical protein
MKDIFSRFLLAVFVFALVASWSVEGHCQISTLSATVVDQAGQALASGTYRIEYQKPAGQTNSPTRIDTGTLLLPTDLVKTGSLDGSGVFSTVVIRTDNIAPSGGRWKIQVCPNAQTQCSSLITAVASPTFNASALLTAAIGSLNVDLTVIPNIPYAYRDTEVTGMRVGSTYWDTTLSIPKWWSGSAWASMVTSAGSYTWPLLQTFSSGITGTGTIGTLGLGSGALGADNIFTGNNSFSGNNTLTGTSLVKSNNGVRNAALYSGADMGAKINAAYADFGAGTNCGEIYIPQGDYTFSTPIATGGRNGCTFRGAGGGGNATLTETNVGTTLIYTGSGTAFSNSLSNYHNTFKNFKLIKNGGASTIGFQITNTFYGAVNDVEINGFPRNFVVYGGPFGSNVVALNNVNSLNASSTALEITGPGSAGQGGYNITVNGGQYNCSTTVSTTGMLINATSTDNNIIAPLINNCGIGIDLDNAASNTFYGPSIQGGVGTTPIRLSTATSSNLFQHPYIFTGNGILDNCGFTCYNQFTEIQWGTSTANHVNVETGDHYVTSFNGTTHPNITAQDYDESGNPRLAFYTWTGAGSNYYPMYIVDAAGGIAIQRADSGTIPSPHTSMANKATVFQTDSNGKITRISNIPTAGTNGVTPIVAVINATAQGANIGSSTLYAVPASGAGLYRVQCLVTLTRAATTSATLPGCSVNWTDNDSVTSPGFQAVVASAVTNTAGAGGWNSTPLIVNLRPSTTIVYQTTGYASSGATTMQYSIHITLEYLGS